MFDRGRRVVLTTFAGTALLGLMTGTAFAQAKFKAVTTFTVIADMARNVAGDAAIVESITKPGAEIHNYQPTPGRHPAGAGGRPRALERPQSRALVREILRATSGTCRARRLRGRRADGHRGGPYTGKPNPHAWMSPEARSIYVDNIREALSQDTIRPTPTTYKANAEAYSAEDPAVRRADPQASLSAIPEERRWLVIERGRLQLPRPRLRPEGALPLADQRRPAGHAAAGPQGDRRGAREQDPVVFSESTISADAGQAGRARDRGQIWRRPLRRLAERRRTARCRPISTCCG